MKWALILIVSMFALADVTRADDPAKYLGTNDKGEAVWTLNSYLKGTTPHIRDLINGEVERLTVLSKETQNDIDKLQPEIKGESEQALKTVRASSDYQVLVAQRDAAEAARKDAHGQDLLDASSAANHAREAIAKMESDAVDNAARSDRESLVKLQTELAQHHSALAKAQSWRENLIDSMRTTFLLSGPVRVGEKGILGKVTVDRVIDAQTFAVRYDALEITGVQDAGEGLQTLQTASHKTMLVLAGAGIDTSKLQHGDELTLDRDFEIADTLVEPGSGNATFLARPAPSEVDALMKAVTTLGDNPK
jgi:hypothetical protein